MSFLTFWKDFIVQYKLLVEIIYIKLWTLPRGSSRLVEEEHVLSRKSKITTDEKYSKKSHVHRIRKSECPEPVVRPRVFAFD